MAHRIADRTMHYTDGAGVRRRVRPGGIIPPGAVVEGPPPPVAGVPEATLLRRRRRAREVRPDVVGQPAETPEVRSEAIGPTVEQYPAVPLAGRQRKTTRRTVKRPPK